MEEKTKAKRKGIHVAIYLLLSILIILSLIYIINFFSLKQEAKEQSKLLSAIDIYEKEGTKEVVQNTSEEVQENVDEMEKRSVKLNGLEDKIEIVCENVINLSKKYKNNEFDVIITNPPYKKKGDGVINDVEEKLISRHEIKANLEDFIKISSNLLKDKGEFYIVHRPERLVDILNLMRKYKIEPKILKMVYSTNDKPPKLVLIKGVRNAKPFLKIEKNLYVYDSDGKYTKDIENIYNN